MKIIVKCVKVALLGYEGNSKILLDYKLNSKILLLNNNVATLKHIQHLSVFIWFSELRVI